MFTYQGILLKSVNGLLCGWMSCICYVKSEQALLNPTVVTWQQWKFFFGRSLLVSRSHVSPSGPSALSVVLTFDVAGCMHVGMSDLWGTECLWSQHGWWGCKKEKERKKQNKNKNFGCQIKTDKSPVLLCKSECVKVKAKKQTKTMQNASMIHSAHLCKQSWSIAAIAYIVSSIILFLFAGSRCCAVWNEWGETHQRIRQHAGNWGTDQPVCAKITLETSEEPIQVLFLCRRNSSKMFLCCYACQCTKHIKQCMQKERLQTFIVLALCVRREYFMQCVLYNITITGKILKKDKKRRRASWVLESGTSWSRRLTFWWG